MRVSQPLRKICRTCVPLPMVARRSVAWRNRAGGWARHPVRWPRRSLRGSPCGPVDWTSLGRTLCCHLVPSDTRKAPASQRDRGSPAKPDTDGYSLVRRGVPRPTCARVCGSLAAACTHGRVGAVVRRVTATCSRSRTPTSRLAKGDRCLRS